MSKKKQSKQYKFPSLDKYIIFDEATESQKFPHFRKYLDFCGEIGEKDRQIAILKSSKDCLVDTVKILQQQLHDQKKQIVEEIRNFAKQKTNTFSGLLSVFDLTEILDKLLKEEN